jgi:hypothetical protein
VHGLYYLHGLATALGVALVTVMLATGSTPDVFAVATAKGVLVLFIALQSCISSASASSSSLRTREASTGAATSCG